MIHFRKIKYILKSRNILKYLNYTLLILCIFGCGESLDGKNIKIERATSSSSFDLNYKILKVDTSTNNEIKKLKFSLYVNENVSNTGQIEKLFESILEEYSNKGNIVEKLDSTEYLFLLYPSKRIAEYEATTLAKYYKNEDSNKYTASFNLTALNGHWMDRAPKLSKGDIKFKELDKRLKGESTTACKVYFEYKELEKLNKLQMSSQGQEIRNTSIYWDLDEKVKDKLAKQYNLSKESISTVINYSAFRCK